MSNHLSLLFTDDFTKLSPSIQREVYRDYYKLVYPVIFFVLKDYQASEDVIQESFLRAIDKASQLQDLSKLEGWLKMLARNVSLNYLRKLKRNRNELDDDDVFIYKEAESAAGNKNLEQEVEVNMLKEAIEEYISVLKPEYRQLIEMRWNDHLSYKEMAAALGTTEGIVRQKLYRARESVKKKLKDEWGLS